MLRRLRKLLIQIGNDGLFAFQKQTGFDEVIKSWETFLHSWRDHAQYHREAKADVSHSRTSHQPAALILKSKKNQNKIEHVLKKYLNFLYLSVNVGTDKNGDGIRPWYTSVLIPPPSHDYRYVETEHE